MRSLGLLALLAAGVPAARAADLPLEGLIDARVGEKLAADGVTPAGQADDATLVRRLTLDLVGRVPTVGEADAYVASRDPAKRAKLVDRLIASPGFARYQAVLFDVMLSDKPGQAGKSGGSLRDYLTGALKDRRPWDAVFRDLMLPDDADPKKKGSAEYLRPKLADLDKLTADVSAAFFGVNVSCAQCHDHPHVKDWTQEHFYGMKGFLARTYDAGGFVAERGTGVVKYKPTKGAEKTARLMFLTGATVETATAREPDKDELKREKEAADKGRRQKAAAAPPAPVYSARAELVALALRPAESDYFARSIVNRLWHRFLGYGLVNPLDQMHAANEASHPALLAELADRVRAGKYDLHALARGIVMSRTYSRASTYDSLSHPAPAAFAVGRLKPMTPQQLATSLKIATTDPKQFENLSPEQFEKRVEQAEQSARGFASLLAQPGTESFQVGVSEALLFSNGGRVASEFLTDGNGSLLARAKAAPDPAAAARLMVRAAFGRDATGAELAALAAYHAARADRPADAHRQALWALVASPEFRFNH